MRTSACGHLLAEHTSGTGFIHSGFGFYTRINLGITGTVLGGSR